MEDWVFVDTCIWASFFTRPSSREKLAVDDLFAKSRGDGGTGCRGGATRLPPSGAGGLACSSLRAVVRDAPRLGPTRDARPARCEG